MNQSERLRNSEFITVVSELTPDPLIEPLCQKFPFFIKGQYLHSAVDFQKYFYLFFDWLKWEMLPCYVYLMLINLNGG